MAGDLGLATTFWIHAIVIPGAVLILTSVLTAYINAASIDLVSRLWDSVLGLFVVSAFAYKGIALIGVWNAAGEYQGRKVWAAIARILALLGSLEVVGGIYTVASAAFGL